jgi:EpsI family protein
MLNRPSEISNPVKHPDTKPAKLSNPRLLIILLLFAVTATVIHLSGNVTKIPIKKDLESFPRKIGEWTLIGKSFFADNINEMLGVDDYINYTYATPSGQTANLYLSYFGAVGVTGAYHSPRNCLPGGGWNVVSLEPVPLDDQAKGIGVGKIQRAIIQKGTEKQVVFYWFYNRGRVITSEYWDKIYLVLDALFKGRRDGSFIRIIAPLSNEDPDKNIAVAADFAMQVSKHVMNFIPGN